MYALQDAKPTNYIWVSATGSDNGLGTATDPVKTIQEAVNRAKPGTAVMVKAGIYTENVTIRTSGAEDLPIQIISADGRGKAQLQPAVNTQDTLRIGGVDHIVVDGLKIEGPDSASYNAVHVYVVLPEFDPPRDIVLKNNDITAHDGDGIKVSKAENVYVVNNHITGSTGAEEGIDFVGVHHGVIGHNEVVDAHSAAINIKGGSYDVLVESNHVDGAGKHGIGVGGYTGEQFFWPGFIGANSYEARDIHVVGNEIEHTVDQGIRVMGAQSVDLTGNWLHDITHSKAIGISAAGSTFHTPAWESMDVTLQNNWFDKANWLGLASALNSTTVGSNSVSGTGPSGGVKAGVVSDYEDFSFFQQGTEVPSNPVPTPTPTPLPPPTPTLPGTTKTITGTSSANTLTGTSGSDLIDGKSGDDKIFAKTGSDVLTGGAGKDAFIFDTALGSTNVDTIIDFNVADDTIRLENSIFTKLTKTGALSSSFFRIGEKALDGNDYIVYNKNTGVLSYDKDGSGSAAAVKFAMIHNKVALTAADFVVI
jgi:hypothetical protein